MPQMGHLHAEGMCQESARPLTGRRVELAGFQTAPRADRHPEGVQTRRRSCPQAALVRVTLMHSLGFFPNSKASIPLVRSK